MDARLHNYLNRQLAILVRGIQRREKNKIRRYAKMWEACKRMHDRAKSDPERRFWKVYLNRLAERAEDIKVEAQRHINRQTLGLSAKEYEDMVEDPFRKKVLS